MRIYDLIKKKREGERLTPVEIRHIVESYTAGSVPDYQMASLAMAIFFRGLSLEELTVWTRAMLESGDIIDLSDIPGIKVDKHSTGGVGDKVSLSLAPIVAACGVPVPMISGRGLGHTGGTLDKLESIPGFRVNLTVSEYRAAVREVGMCLIGQTARIVPADRKLYALRDVTATVDCLPLIASSIMSKKLAEGIDALVLDVKVGSGAFMKDREQARQLARTMVHLGCSMGKKVTALLTDMDQPLGRTVGNSLEVVEAVEMLKQRAPKDYTELTIELAAEMIVLGGVARDSGEGRRLAEQAVSDGSALERFKACVAAQGGNTAALDDYSLLPSAPYRTFLEAGRDGFVTSIQTEEVGIAAMVLGAGRERADASVDPGVGLVLLKKVGEVVKRGEPMVEIHYSDDRRLDEARSRLIDAYRICDESPIPSQLVLERIEGETLFPPT